RYVQHIAESGRHLLALINDVLDLSKVEAGRMELELGPAPLRQVLENGLTMVLGQASRHGIQLTLQVAPGIGGVDADERKVKQIIFNLLSNAVKFTPDGGQVEVMVTAVANDAVQVSVHDTGPGVAQEDHQRIFDEFEQVGPGRLRATAGTGLGLSVAKKLVELHGGLIWVESKSGAVNTFSLTLPVRHTART